MPDKQVLIRAFTRSWLMNAVYFAIGIVLFEVRPAFVLYLVIGLAVVMLFCWLTEERCDILLACLLAVLGWGYAGWHHLPFPGGVLPLGDISISGTVISYPRVQDGRSGLVIKTGHEDPYLKKMQVFCDFEVILQPGTLIGLQGELKELAGPGNPGEFDYPRHLAKNHIYFLLQVADESDMEVRAQPKGLGCLLPALRNGIVDKAKQTLPQQEAALILSMVLGLTDNLDEDLYQDFQRTGLVHLFAVSGLNIGFIIIFAALLNSIAGLSRRAAFFSTIAWLLLYSSLTAWPVSVQRAFIMASLSLLAVALGRGHLASNGLGLAALLIMLIDPQALFTIAFQLSFLATWGLVVLFPALKEYLGYKQRYWDLVLIPVCAQLAVMPLVAYYFHLITPVSLLSNLLVVYVAGGIVITGFAALLLVLPCPALSALMLVPTGICARLLLWLNAFCNSLPFSHWIVATPSILLIALYFIGLLWWLYLLQGREVSGCKRPLFLMGLALLMFLVPPWLLHKNEIWLTFIDVGQGDSILIKSPANRFILIDGGGSLFSDIGKRKVLPFLDHLGINRLFMVINTHADLDHIKGLEAVMADRRVDYLALAAVSLHEPEAQNLLRLAEQQGSQLVALQLGQKLEVDGLELQVWCPKGDLNAGDSLNEKSLVLFCSYKNFTALLTGDQNQENLAEAWRRHRRASLIVKAPHHGSRYSWCPDLIRQAEWVVISAGSNNVFGHPHREVLDDIARSQARLLRTDENGAITMKSDGRRLIVRTFK